MDGPPGMGAPSGGYGMGGPPGGYGGMGGPPGMGMEGPYGMQGYGMGAGGPPGMGGAGFPCVKLRGLPFDVSDADISMFLVRAVAWYA